jgi:HlyD family secretion protein
MSQPQKRRALRGVLAISLLAGLIFAAWEFRGFLPFDPGRGANQQASADREQSEALARAPVAITALGRIEPRDGVIRISGPSRLAVVIGELRVAEGDEVKAGGVLAVLDSHALEQASVESLRAELANAKRKLARNRKLHGEGAIAGTTLETDTLARDVARAQLRSAEAALARSTVRAPIDGQVLKIHARPGEKVGPQGILELGRTDEMYAIAEVYETDVRRIKVGQRARVSSPALEAPLEGVVERVGMKIGKLDALSTDPAARTDARVVEVEIRLDDSEPVKSLTNLQVEIAIAP